MKTASPLQFTLLTALTGRTLHGYALVEEVLTLTGQRPGVATVYAALEKLLALGWIAQTQDEIVGGRLRRYYAISETGLHVLDLEAKALAQRAQRAQFKLQQVRTAGAQA